MESQSYGVTNLWGQSQDRETPGGHPLVWNKRHVTEHQPSISTFPPPRLSSPYLVGYTMCFLGAWWQREGREDPGMA